MNVVPELRAVRLNHGDLCHGLPLSSVVEQKPLCLFATMSRHFLKIAASCGECIRPVRTMPKAPTWMSRFGGIYREKRTTWRWLLLHFTLRFQSSTAGHTGDDSGRLWGSVDGGLRSGAGREIIEKRSCWNNRWRHIADFANILQVVQRNRNGNIPGLIQN